MAPSLRGRDEHPAHPVRILRHSLERDLELPFSISELGQLRRLVRRAASEVLELERAEDFAMAVNELTTNSVRHGGGAGTLRLWRDQQALMCEVRDSGHIEHRRGPVTQPDTELLTGRGLWLVEQICDVMEIHSSPRTGSCVRVQMQLPAHALWDLPPA